MPALNIMLDESRTYLFLFAHPDDDAFICGTMKMLLDRGASVHAAWLTSGDFFGQGTRREAELAKVASHLKLDSSRIHLLRFPDLGLVSTLEQAAGATTNLVSSVRPDTIFVNAFEGGHPDHDSVNFLAYEARSRTRMSADLFEFPLYNGTGPVHHWRWRINGFPPDAPDVLYNALDEMAIDCKYRIMRVYSSQWMYMIPARLASSRRRLRQRGEPYRRCPDDRDHTTRPYPGTLNYERWFNFFMKITFDDFKEAVRRTRSTRM
ncbi:MAG: PIG-L deacetylase family protein [Thermodesulfobacteriota bacterium]